MYHNLLKPDVYGLPWYLLFDVRDVIASDESHKKIIESLEMSFDEARHTGNIDFTLTVRVYYTTRHWTSNIKWPTIY